MAKEPAKPAAQKSGKWPKAFRIHSRRAGFRRAGRAWSTEPVVVSADEFTDEQLLALADEPMLTVVPVESGE